MNKRVLIFSPEVREREEIEEIVKMFFKSNFGKYYSQIDFQKYSTLGEPVKDNQIGHWGLGEILVIFDRHISPKTSQDPSFKNTPYFRALKVSYDMSRNLCDEKEIPYIIYEGEMTKKEEKKFIFKIEEIRDQIKSRLEAKLE